MAVIALAMPRETRADQGAFSLGMAFYGTTLGKSLSGASGYVAHFISETSGNYVRPAIGMFLESASGTIDTDSAGTTADVSLLHGGILAGLHFFFFKTAFVRPYLSTYGSLGWGQLTWNAIPTTGLSFGGVIGGGAELRWKDDPKSKSIRISTMYRYSMVDWSAASSIVSAGGTSVSMTGIEFQGPVFSVGMTF